MNARWRFRMKTALMAIAAVIAIYLIMHIQ